jgi:putative Holliday junction resolvase
MAIDLGKVRVGIAVADELGLLAHPRPYLDGRDPGRLVESLRTLALSEGVDHFIVGLPRAMSGEEGLPARRARQFAEQLRRRTGMSVELIDERLTTRQALSRLRDQNVNLRRARQRVDSEAAAIVLQQWLDGRRPRV